MPLGIPIPGANWAVEYTVSGVPWVSSSTGPGITQFVFPYITKFFVVKNTSPTLGPNISIGFTANGVAGQNSFALAPAESFSGEIRCNQIFISGSGAYTCSVIAGLTTIPGGSMPILTASNGFTGVG